MTQVVLTVRHGFSYENLMRSRNMPLPQVVHFLQENLGPKAALYATTLFDLVRGCPVRMPFADQNVPLTFGSIVKAYDSGLSLARLGVEVDQALISPFLRTRQTGNYLLSGYQHVSGRTVAVRDCDFLRERNGGITFGYPDAYYRHLFPETAALYHATPKCEYRPPNGETVLDVYERIRANLFGVLSRYPDQTILIVAHEMVNLCIDAVMLGIGIEERLRMPEKIPNLGFYRYEKSSNETWQADSAFRGKVLV